MRIPKIEFHKGVDGEQQMKRIAKKVGYNITEMVYAITQELGISATVRW